MRRRTICTSVPGMMKETAVMFTVMLIIVVRLLVLVLVLSMMLKVGPVSLIEVPVGCLGGLLRTAVLTVNARAPLRVFCFFRPVGRHVTIVVAAVRIMPIHSRIIGCRSRRIVVGRVRDGVRLITTIGERVWLMREGLVVVMWRCLGIRRGIIVQSIFPTLGIVRLSLTSAVIAGRCPRHHPLTGTQSLGRRSGSCCSRRWSLNGRWRTVRTRSRRQMVVLGCPLIMRIYLLGRSCLGRLRHNWRC